MTKKISLLDVLFDFLKNCSFDLILICFQYFKPLPTPFTAHAALVQSREKFQTNQWNVFAGSKDGQKITFYGEGDQEPNLQAGDVIIVLDERPHKTFKRKHNDLICNLEITLTEALCGFKKPIETLDGRTLILTSFPGLLWPSNTMFWPGLRKYPIFIYLSKI